MILISPDNEYPRFYGDLQLEHPDWEPGAPVPEGWTLVTPVDAPQVGENEILIELSPALKDGAYVQVWDVRPMTEEERAVRDAPATALAKLEAAGLSPAELLALKSLL